MRRRWLLLLPTAMLVTGFASAQADEKLPPRALRRITTAAPPSKEVPVGCLAFSPDSKNLAYSARDLRIVEVSSGKELRRLNRRVYWPTQIAFSRDGASLVFIDRSKAVFQWKWQTANEPERFYEHAKESLGPMAMSADGNSIAVGDLSNDRVYLWRGTDAKATFACRSWPLSFCLENKGLLTGGMLDREGRVGLPAVLDVTSGKELHQVPDKQYQGATDADVAIPYFSVPTRDGRSVLLHAGQNVRWWDLADGKLVREWSFPAEKPGSLFIQNPRLALTAEGGRLAVASDEKAIRMYDAKSGTLLYRLEADQGKHFFSLAFSPDGQVLASGGQDGTILLWDVRPKKE